LRTRQIVADLILERFGVALSPSGVGKILHRLGLTPQKPLRRAYERDEKAVQEWVDDVYPKVKKYAKKKGAEIFWLDEPLFVQMILYSVPGVKKGRHLSSQQAVKDRQLMRSQRYRIKVAFGITFLTENLMRINVLNA